MVRLKRTAVMTAVAALLLLGACAYFAKGFRVLLTTTPMDLHSRWVEQQYIFHRQDPYDVHFAHFEPYASTHKPTGRNEAVDPNVGVPIQAGYPPWEFFVGYLLYWLPWRVTGAYIAGWNLLAIVVLLGWSFCRGRRAGGEFAGVLLGASVAAIASICTTLGNGQYGVLVTALLVGSVLLDEADWPLAAGMLAGAASLKPNISGPFLCAFLVRRRWPGLIGAAGFVALGSVVIWGVIGVNPIEMLRQMMQGADSFVADAYGPPNLLMALGVSARAATGITAGAGALAAVALTVAYRRIPLSPLFGMLSVIARLWAYHKTYDNLTVLFLLVALGELMVSGAGSKWAAAAFWAVGISIWLPAKLTDIPAFQIFQMFVWLGGLIVLCAAWRNRERLVTDEIQPQATALTA